MDNLRQRFAFNHKSHFGIEHGGSRVKIQRTNKHFLTINTERFGMETGTGVPR
ncbi:hypothetical protein D3C80_1923770 [compost metagenome]